MADWFGFLCSACSSQPKGVENGGLGQPSKTHTAVPSPADKTGWFRRPNNKEAAKSDDDVPTLAGVGVVFRAARNGDGDLRVVAVAPDGPAKESGKVFSGQKLIEIEGTKVAGLDNSDIAGLILGAPGSEVELVLENEEGDVHSVILTRQARIHKEVKQVKAFIFP
mmetsp:Transcript_93368/g.150728  ORF Transcript_93368/g.150728 Transcript_93368/m.150728 type:complete len:166 (+) Transcript_93368:1035-1532(+)|eukprot:CAMPEP_0179416436 /NCGR_PEP_ID=MMETSP0799-20121207/6798_1 /TAXON_ID=46947 /ORGANISM="Geminigera cryophila, Strain CCMP2564" /LENGTH=165 /DNA_ID=CAMNT_0021189309 /DNA_START=1742 /DNA_END=2239 /DNA_ORIENTATION=+